MIVQLQPWSLGQKGMGDLIDLTDWTQSLLLEPLSYAPPVSGLTQTQSIEGWLIDNKDLVFIAVGVIVALALLKSMR